MEVKEGWKNIVQKTRRGIEIKMYKKREIHIDKKERYILKEEKDILEKWEGKIFCDKKYFKTKRVEYTSFVPKLVSFSFLEESNNFNFDQIYTININIYST
jgi:hypothetical protein